MACVHRASQGPEPASACPYPSNTLFDSTRIEDLAGAYELTLVADSFPIPGATVSGQLILRVNTDTLRRRYVFSVPTRQWRKFGERPLVGTADINLKQLFAPVSRDPRSTDPDAPGVYFEQAYGEFLLGVQPNLTDGTSTELVPSHVWPDGFRGRWIPNYGIATIVDSTSGKPAHVGGVFCAVRSR